MINKLKINNKIMIFFNSHLVKIADVPEHNPGEPPEYGLDAFEIPVAYVRKSIQYFIGRIEMGITIEHVVASLPDIRSAQRAIPVNKAHYGITVLLCNPVPKSRDRKDKYGPI